MISASLFLTSFLLFAQEKENEYWELQSFTPPSGAVVEVGGMDFDSKGVLWISTRRGQVWKVENALAENPSDAQWTLWAEGLVDGLGLKVVEDEVWLVQRNELSRLRDEDGDGFCDSIDTISQAWAMTGNYHEFAFGLPQDEEGNFYISTNVGFWSPEWWHGMSKAPWRGWILRMTPDGVMTPVASGVRSPSGLGRDADGNIWYTDNQGDWMPVCGVFPVKDGAFFGHPASLRWTDDYGNGEQIPSSLDPPDRDADPAAIWLPYDWSRSTGNLVADETEGAFGPFGEQLFAAELTLGRVLRLIPEQVDGTWQGAVIPFRKDLGSACRVRFAPDGSLFLGYTNRGWGGRTPGDGLARLRWTGKEVKEMASVSLLANGFRVQFTEPVQGPVDVSQIKIHSYDYNWWWDYGSPEMREKELTVANAYLSADGMELDLHVDGLEAGRCVRAQLSGLGLLHDEFSYTVNRMPGGEVVPVAKRVEPPSARVADDVGWLHLTWGDATQLWEGEGWKLCAIGEDPENPKRFSFGPGNSALANVGENPGAFRSKVEFGDVEFRFNIQLPKGGDSGLYFMERYELQLVDDAGAFGGVVRTKNPRARGWRGPHEWHQVTGKFFAPRFDGNGKKIRNARFEDVAVDGVTLFGAAECDGPTGGGLEGEVAQGKLFFQGRVSQVALGDVRMRPLTPKVNTDGWSPFPKSGVELSGDWAIHSELKLGDEEYAIRLGDYEVRLNAAGSSSAKTGSILPGSPIYVDLIPAQTDFMLDIVHENQVLSVYLNGVRINKVVPGFTDIISAGMPAEMMSVKPGTTLFIIR